MLKPDEKQLRALMNLKDNVAFETFMEWVEQSLHIQSIQNNHRSGEILLKGAGRNLELEEILDYAEKASDYLINMKQAAAKH